MEKSEKYGLMDGGCRSRDWTEQSMKVNGGIGQGTAELTTVEGREIFRRPDCMQEKEPIGRGMEGLTAEKDVT